MEQNKNQQTEDEQTNTYIALYENDTEYIGTLIYADSIQQAYERAIELKENGTIQAEYDFVAVVKGKVIRNGYS